MSNEYFVLYGIKDDNIYYIANTNPIIWAPYVDKAKIYYNRYTAEYDVLRDYDNYRSVMSQIEAGNVDELYVASIIDLSENWRVKIL